MQDHFIFASGRILRISSYIAINFEEYGSGWRKDFLMRYNPNKEQRIIDPENDVFPHPLLNVSPSKKRIGGERLVLAAFYFQYKRLAEYVAEMQDIEDTYEDLLRRILESFRNDGCDAADLDETEDKLRKEYTTYEELSVYSHQQTEERNIYISLCYSGNVLSQLCETMMPSNIPYASNYPLYIKTLEALLKSLRPANALRMIRENEKRNAFPIEKMLRGNRILEAIVLLHYGANIKIPSDTDPRVGDSLERGMTFFRTERAKKVEECGLEPGKKLMVLLEKNTTCPITHCKLKSPVIIGDGFIYESDAIVEWLTKKNKSPMTGLNISFPCVLFDLIENEFFFVYKSIMTQTGYKIQYTP